MWRKWKESFNLYVDLAISEADDLQKLKMFKYVIGVNGREIYSTLEYDHANEADRTIAEVL